MNAVWTRPSRLAYLKQHPLHPIPLSQSKRRTFVPNPFASNSSPSLQTLTASRTLPYPSAAIYAIIADVSSYSSFLPFCLSSEVTRWSAPDVDGKKWPSEASLQVGWGSITETFRSRIYCVPEKIVEAVGGQSETTLQSEDIKHHNNSDGRSTSRESGIWNGQGQQILTHLQSRWTLNPFPYQPPPVGNGKRTDPAAPTDTSARHQTEVQLSLSFAFANPIYSAMSSAVTPKVAGMMIEAFEKRVATLLDAPSVGGKKLDSINGLAARS
ncbi:hypothetical protein NA57DRAFT_56296 [Rhizodiscina lignyota]|uniref:Coenzyme Q-binding protein COQ10 START domain-containing protein n=1 Tax=Rhizodiscina lignyota TaxID=1504668 RepID=A0A9P4IEQ2_9PEZI|nr:hypothetical protein NA57DRAFT_56296 [Rhizodiscina lignyota]